MKTARTMLAAITTALLLALVPTAAQATTTTAPAAVSCTAAAVRPYQLPGQPPRVNFVARFTCTRTMNRIDVTVFAYQDGAYTGYSDTETCLAATECQATTSAPKAWGCHNYQDSASGGADGGQYDGDWSSIWQGCR